MKLFVFTSDWDLNPYAGTPTQPKSRVRHKPTWSGLAAAAAKLLHSCPTLCDPIDSSPPGSPIPGILQARVLEWGAIAFQPKPTVLVSGHNGAQVLDASSQKEFSDRQRDR